jgi:(E)-4-hydroxy-3-methylbut-2-enyl-diphosphate synthase
MLRVRRKSKPIFLQNKTGKSDAKSVWIGGDHPVVVQSMTTTDTADADKTLEQVYGLAMEGCEVVRVTVKDPPDAAGLPAIVYRSPVPIVADIHFDHKMALAAIEAGVAKLRLNPGNIRDPKKVIEVVTAAKARNIPIRVGVNMGSLAADLEKSLGHTPEAMVLSALRHVEILEEHGHTDIAISLKAHDVATTVHAYRLMDQRLRDRETPYALHLGITEAGLLRDGTIKSSIGLGILLWPTTPSKRYPSAGGFSNRSGCAKKASKSRPARRAGGLKSRFSSSAGRSKRSRNPTARRSRWP